MTTTNRTIKEIDNTERKYHELQKGFMGRTDEDEKLVYTPVTGEEYKELKIMEIDTGMKILLPRIQSSEMDENIILSTSLERFPCEENDDPHMKEVYHLTLVTLSGKVTLGWWGDDPNEKYIHPRYLFKDQNGVLVLSPRYLGYYKNDESYVYWFDGDTIKGEDPSTLQRVIALVEQENFE